MSDVTNPFSYASRTFAAFMADINNDPRLRDKPDFFKRMIAGLGDVLTLQQDAIFNDSFLSTAFTRQSVFRLCELIDYQLAPQSTSSGVLIFYAKPEAIFPFSVPAADLKALSDATSQLNSRQFESRSDAVFPSLTGMFTADAVNDTLAVPYDFVRSGHCVRFTTSDTLPAPLQADTDYYLIWVNFNTVKVAASVLDVVNGISIDITDVGVGVHEFRQYSKDVTVFQQKSAGDQITLGQSNGSAWQSFDLPDTLVLFDTVQIEILSTIWTKVDSLIASGPSSEHYVLRQKSDGKSYVQFGNGTFGKIPDNLADILVTYAAGGGIDSNIQSPNRVKNYAGGDANIRAVSNVLEELTGGADAESESNAKFLAPLQLKARDRFVTSQDGEALVLKFSDVTQAKVNRLVYGPNTCQVLTVAAGGGNLSALRRGEIQSFLIDRTVLESIDVRVIVSTFITVDVTAAAKMLGGYLWANVEPFFRLAFKLLTTETGREIKSAYDDFGIARAVQTINLNLGETFGSGDYQKIIPLLDALEPRQFGDTIQESEVIAYVQGKVDGIDYMTITTFGTGFPYSLPADALTTVGTLTLSEI